MTKHKYNYFDMLKVEELPTDVNSHLSGVKRILNSPEADEMIQWIEADKRFGEMLVYDANLKIVFKAHFRAGMNKQAEVIKHGQYVPKRPFKTAFMASVLNDELSFEKVKNERN